MNHTLSVNRLPMRTYRWLKMNTEKMEMGDVSLSAISSDPPEQLPAGVRVRRAVTEEQILSLFEKEIEEIREGDGKAIPPNGDAYVTSGQKIPTGMGKKIDRLMEDQQVRADVYTVEEHTKVEDALFLRYSPGNHTASLLRQVIHVKKGGELTVLTDAYTHRSYDGFFGVQTLLLVEEGARIRLVKVQMLGGGFTHFDDTGAVLKEGAVFDYVRLDFGTDQTFAGLAVNLLKDDAAFHCEAGYLARRKQSYDYNFIATHRGRRTTGVMHFHGVLLDSAKKLLRGTIDFRAGASGAEGEENEDALLLSEHAVNRTIPVILCQEENISGHHGATIGQLSDEMLFYMQSRGFSEEEAKKLMIRAKIMRVANLIPEGELKSHVNAYLCDTL